jgi:hypothetical protein
MCLTNAYIEQCEKPFRKNFIVRRKNWDDFICVCFYGWVVSTGFLCKNTGISEKRITRSGLKNMFSAIMGSLWNDRVREIFVLLMRFVSRSKEREKPIPVSINSCNLHKLVKICRTLIEGSFRSPDITANPKKHPTHGRGTSLSKIFTQNFINLTHFI